MEKIKGTMCKKYCETYENTEYLNKKQDKDKYTVIALIGKAGAGKDYIYQHCSLPFNKIISCTTRPPRQGEYNGQNYYFLTPEEFKERIANNEMLEYMEFRGWYYGTSINELRKDNINIGVFNPTGIRNMLKNPNIELYVYYVQAKDRTRLLRQLEREYNPDVMEIIRRFQADEKDFNDLEFSYNIIWNDDLDKSK